MRCKVKESNTSLDNMRKPAQQTTYLYYVRKKQATTAACELYSLSQARRSHSVIAFHFSRTGWRLIQRMTVNSDLVHYRTVLVL
ncbi:unnamed protein product, partial [Brenthis ino]